jgi:hypothetical protein
MDIRQKHLKHLKEKRAELAMGKRRVTCKPGMPRLDFDPKNPGIPTIEEEIANIDRLIAVMEAKPRHKKNKPYHLKIKAVGHLCLSSL